MSIEDATAVLAKCAAYDPWFPQPQKSVAIAWAEHFEPFNLTRADLLAAVTKVYTEHGSGYRPLPKDISDAGRAIRRDRFDRGDQEARDRYEAICDAKAEGRRDRIASFANRFGQVAQ